MSVVALRRMRWWDVEPVLELERALFPDPWTAAAFWSELAGWPRTRHLVVAADTEDTEGTEGTARIVGYAGLMVTTGTADVQTLAVRPDAQGRGIGGALLTDLVDVARSRGCEAVLLEVRADNEAAVALYARAGFAVISTRRGYYDAGRTDALVMRLLLDGGSGA